MPRRRTTEEFLQRFLPAQPGDIITPEGDVIGQHQGLMYYTLGQRQGLGIGGMKTASEEPWFVVGKNLQTNQLIAGQGHNHPLLLKRQLSASQIHWVAGKAPANSFKCKAKIRYRQTEQPCKVIINKDSCVVCFDEKQRAITPGQSLVFYDGEICLGGGIIDEMQEKCD